MAALGVPNHVAMIMDGNGRWAKKRLLPRMAGHARGVQWVRDTVRTGGEQRISNFLLWQRAYAELYFIDTLWPAFDAAEMEQVLTWYAQRERRYGQTSQQFPAIAG